MTDSTIEDSALPTGEGSVLEAFEAELGAAKKRILEDVPEHIIALGGIIRDGIEEGTIASFRDFLNEHSIPFQEDWLHDLRDLIVIQRFDLKDLEPEARQRLRRRTLEQDAHVPTDDYVAACKSGIPNCRDCEWFVNAPNDSDDNSELSCVQMGTKGADLACVGFTNKDSEKLNT